MKILLVEPWLTGSHQGWAEGYQTASRHEVSIVSLPGELWRWRLRGGALPLARKLVEWIDLNGQPDLLLISGLVDVAELLGLSRRNLSPSVPVVVYQHESQLAYPVASGNFDQGAALRNWMSWCAADLVLFNSYYHMRRVLAALPNFVETLPDLTHEPMLDTVMSRFEVFPVGVDMSQIAALADSAKTETGMVALSEEDTAHKPLKFSENKPGERNVVKAGSLVEMELTDAEAATQRSERPTILWPHRWERDKDPKAFLTALRKLKDSRLDFGLVLAGQDPPSGSELAQAERQAVETEFASNIVSSGELTRPQYLKQIARCDLVVSCAKHEFFGVAVVEAIASGCVPLLPHALSYPELVRPPWHQAVLYEPGSFGKRLVDAVERVSTLRTETQGLTQSMRRFSWETIADTYDDRLESIAGRVEERPSVLELSS